MVPRTWTLKKTIYDYTNETCWDGPDLQDDESVKAVEIDPRLRDSLERVFVTARETQTLDTFTLLPVAELLKALGWSADDPMTLQLRDYKHVRTYVVDRDPPFEKAQGVYAKIEKLEAELAESRKEIAEYGLD